MRARRSSAVIESNDIARVVSSATCLWPERRMRPVMIQYGAVTARPQRLPLESASAAKPGMKYSSHTPATRNSEPKLNDSVRTRAGDTSACVA